MNDNEIADMKIKAVSYSTLMTVIRKNLYNFPDKEKADVALLRDAADAVFFEPKSKRTPELVEQAFSMLKVVAVQKRMPADAAGELITALQRLVSASIVKLPPGRPSQLRPNSQPLTGFDRWRADGEHII